MLPDACADRRAKKTALCVCPKWGVVCVEHGADWRAFGVAVPNLGAVVSKLGSTSGREPRVCAAHGLGGRVCAGTVTSASFVISVISCVGSRGSSNLLLRGGRGWHAAPGRGAVPSGARHCGNMVVEWGVAVGVGVRHHFGASRFTAMCHPTSAV